MRDLGFESIVADPDVWRRAQTKPNGEKYYELILIYADDLHIVSHDPHPLMMAVDEKYKIKKGSIGPPSTYLGSQVMRHNLPGGQKSCWAMLSEKYTGKAVLTIKQLLFENGNNEQLKSTAKVPIPNSYKPELDFLEELDYGMISPYGQLIGILQWAVELGRIDIHIEASLMSQYMASP